MAINSDVEDWRGVGSNDSGERVWLLQSPSVDSVQHLETDRRSGGVSCMGAVFIVVNAALGAGLLNFPAAFNMAGGVTAGVMLQMFMLIFIISGLVILGYCSQVSNENTYQEVVRTTCGKVTGVLCEVAIAVYTFGTCIAFFIVIGDQLDRLIEAVAHDTDGTVSGHWYTNRKFTIFVTAVFVILPLSIPKEIGFQKYASALSVMGTWYVTIVVIIKYIWPDKVTPGYVPTSSSSWTAVFNAMPTICFGFQCHVSCVPVFNSMRRKAIRPWGLVVTLSMIICLFVYTGTGVCGFLTFGSSVSQDVLMSYPPDDIAVAIARAFIVICVVTSYPILHFCGRAVVEGLWLRFQGEQVEVCVRREKRRRILQTLVWCAVTLVLALFIPDIGRVISLIGGLAACFIFIFPGLCLMQAKLSETDSRSASWHGLVIFGVFMVTIGAFIFGLTTTNSIYQDIVS
ncbi:sodium-coupled neutral amino acid transporter 7 isoform X1 [Mastacembelus armatus]|uniref:sodium-coupled neutral amino acid transporter 7 isoform X1 n=2 Tax=Mastacembelus armatus TaxID=205130 RepID=UPI000E45D5C4|nr:putative sodium-coupled neutral amino acid transporter 7 isoform X1 [Mastacembelus armatus]XP_026175827.1 putative sodium-coupled neutral amino acid transporter 7 isoform X1 [Mastacembelus armatus]XP_026175828.1 putative sodium-coupled neutral amino acid transporter 7 isoform X1 [Mastacembelus armatus]XP_026175829.1 putative sodium-coupled neutral amino acid transporter 7 isoform X1 [Mastacembelus armatus]XP_026175830.1 putative sodium-coupled neutral amino acid transporter 7 isoform X1 [Mas